MHAVLTRVEDDTCAVSTHKKDDTCVECVVFVDKQLTRERGLKQHACFNSVVDIEQAARKKDRLIEQMKEVEKKDEEIIQVSLNHDISDSSHLHSL